MGNRFTETNITKKSINGIYQLVPSFRSVSFNETVGEKNHSIETESAYKSDRTTGKVSTLDTRDNGERKGNAEQEKKKQNKNDKRYDV